MKRVGCLLSVEGRGSQHRSKKGVCEFSCRNTLPKPLNFRSQVSVLFLLLTFVLNCKIVSKVKCEVAWDAYTGDVIF